MSVITSALYWRRNYFGVAFRFSKYSIDQMTTRLKERAKRFGHLIYKSMTIMSLILCAMALAFWARSYFVEDAWHANIDCFERSFSRSDC